MASALHFADVRKTFGPTAALEQLTLELAPGELISLLGPSGCGKTTALRIAAGFEIPDSGTVTLGGREITRIPPNRRNMGMVFQSYSLFPNLTVAENLAFGLRVRRAASAARAARVGEMLERVQLGAMSARYPHQLSGGQQQRVALARALAIQPDVLLLDEPLSALDAKVRVTLRDEIRRLQTELGTTTLFVTHDQEEALAISDRVGVMSNGRLEQLDTPTEVYRRPANAFVARFVGSMNEVRTTRSAGGRLEVAGVALAGRAPPSVGGSSLDVLVRPEDVALCAAGAAGGLPGSVVGQVFAGATTLVRVRLDGVDSLVTAAVRGTDVDLAAGDRVGVLLDTRRAIYEPVAAARSGAD
ncbi:MAG: spermidine/putrescine transporter ATP-binding protein [Ilumatobacteraceae bacterium]|nr:spermidine/putrescine transporter ATP-binding protein [Ilumatobacteraceae bacterium]